MLSKKFNRAEKDLASLLIMARNLEEKDNCNHYFDCYASHTINVVEATWMTLPLANAILIYNSVSFS
jgi:hypothetical protein